MKDWVKQKMDKIDELYSSERIKKSKNRWTKLWHGKTDFDKYPVNFMTSFDYYNGSHSPEERLKLTLDEIILHGYLQDDFIPSIFPGCRVSTFPNIFGIKEICIDGNYSCEKTIKKKEDIFLLPEPSLEKSSVAQNWMNMQKYFVEETDGKIPVHVVDMQGPIDICAQIWSYDELFIAAYIDTKAFHHIMDLATNAFILFWEAQQKLLGEHFVGTHLFAWDWLPPDMGASLSADSLVMVSPDFYNEFFKPYLVKIGERFGGLAVHSCGDFTKNLTNVCATPTVKAINASQLTAKQMVEAGLTRETLAITSFDFKDAEETLKLIKEHNLRMNMTFYFPYPTKSNKIISIENWTKEDWNYVTKTKDIFFSKFQKYCL